MISTTLPSYYRSYIWKEFRKDITGLMNTADLTDGGNKAFGTVFEVSFYRDAPMNDKDTQKFIDRMTKTNEVEFIIINGKKIFDRKKYNILSDGQTFMKKDEMIEAVKIKSLK